MPSHILNRPRFDHEKIRFRLLWTEQTLPPRNFLALLGRESFHGMVGKGRGSRLRWWVAKKNPVPAGLANTSLTLLLPLTCPAGRVFEKLLQIMFGGVTCADGLGSISGSGQPDESGSAGLTLKQGLVWPARWRAIHLFLHRGENVETGWNYFCWQSRRRQGPGET